MLYIVYGGSASGKSAYAEGLAQSLGKSGHLLYVATMYPYKWNTKEMDAETSARISRHRRMRAEKGFETVECYRQPGSLCVTMEDVILLECMSNLLANELYPPDGGVNTEPERTANRIVKEIETLQQTAKAVVIVTNDIFSDGAASFADYDDSTKKYIRDLAYINRKLAVQADAVIEVVCGIPVFIKQKAEFGI